MLKKSPALLFLVLMCLGAASAQKKVAPDWPGVPYSSVKVFLYNLDNQLYGQYSRAWDKGKPNFTLEGTGTGLTAEQVKQLMTVLNSDTRMLNEGLAKCYEPHHAVFFYDAAGKIVAAFDVCFLCEGIKFYPAKQYKSEITHYTEALTKKAEQQLEEIKKVFGSAGVTVFKDEHEVNYYRDYEIGIGLDTMTLVNDSIFKTFLEGYKTLGELKKAIGNIPYLIDSSFHYLPNRRIDADPVLSELTDYYTFMGRGIKLNCSRRQLYGLYYISDFMLQSKSDLIPSAFNIGKTRNEVNQTFDSLLSQYAYNRTIRFVSKDSKRSLIVHFDEKLVDQVSYYTRP